MAQEAGRVHAVPFAMVPEWVLEHPDLSDRAVRLYGLLARSADREGRAFPGRKRLADRLRCSATSVDRAVAELVAVDAVASRPRSRPDGSRTSNDYYVWPASPPDAELPMVRTGGGTPPHGCVGVATPVGTQEQKPGNETPGGLTPSSGVRTSGAPKRPHQEAADRVARQVWDSRDPRPAQPFPAVRKVAELLLDAGWPEAAVQEGMLHAPTISTRSVEFLLNRSKLGRRRQPTQARDAQEGVVPA